ncbi:hypothetical protein AWB67_06263 [Caballeronia terrestris]|uniref:Uncharacterized protein n=1 Tax=Caballeronia terrestris TaxID=1226301 RepID=A0A158KQC2_9BURK|nr:hypothetical protein AWB67_06263 [Caballeronia terrestris]
MFDFLPNLDFQVFKADCLKVSPGGNNNLLRHMLRAFEALGAA